MIYIAKDISKNVLVHYGTKNMKWGVRKYQNEDGTLTEAGKKRYRDKLPSSAAKAAIDESDVKSLDPTRYQKRTYFDGKNPTYIKKKDIDGKTFYEKVGIDSYVNESDARKIYSMIGPNATGMSKEALDKAVNKYGLSNLYNMQSMALNTIRDAEDKREQQYKNQMPTSAKEAKKNEQIREKNAKNAAKYEGQIPTSARLGMQGKNVIQKVKAGKGSMPTSAITAQQRAKNESIVKSRIPASAWNSKTSYINRGPKAKTSGLSTFMKKSLGK